ncbi:Histone H1 [Euphorbia peplus]|nr:Histone H1 [Euphorbia peplus]
MSPAVTGTPAKSKAKVAKETKSKKAAAAAPKKVRSYPPYSEMINEAIVSLKERTGSSQIAIAKFIEEKQKANLPANFKKLLFVQLKKLVANGKLVKVKNSFKLPSKSAPVAAAPVAKPKAKKEVAPKKAAPKKAVKTAVAKSPAKKVVKAPVKKAAVAKKKTPVKVAKKPKSIKSPVKKTRATRANK